MKLKPNIFKQHQLLKKEVEHLREQATKDPLTGLLNRRGFTEHIEPIIDEVKYHLKNPKDKRKTVVITSLSLLMVDLDNFKKINDNYGHPAGDRVLIRTAKILASGTRSIDLPARWGGEEFIVALVGAPKERTAEIAETLREKIERVRVREGNTAISPTISIGATTLTSRDTLAKIITRADKALYQAKKSGKNRVVSL